MTSPQFLANILAVGVLVSTRAVSSEDVVSQRCPIGTKTRYAGPDGDCKCNDGFECVKGETFRAGCPYSGGNDGTMYFSPACADCKCQTKDRRTCPASAVSEEPDLDDNCACTGSSAYCYKDAKPDEQGHFYAGCDRMPRDGAADAQPGKRYNDTEFFRYDCAECHCMPPRYAVQDSDTMDHCNADRPQCLQSPSVDIGFVCENTEWVKCCDEDHHGCFTKCCQTLPGWTVMVICLSALVVIMSPVGACYYWQKHKKRGVAPSPELNDEVGNSDSEDDEPPLPIPKGVRSPPQALLAPGGMPIVANARGGALPPVRGQAQLPRRGSLGADGGDDGDLADVDEEMFPGDVPGQVPPRKERRGSAKSNRSRRGSAATSRRGSAASRRGSAVSTGSQKSQRWSGLLSPGGGIQQIDWDFFAKADADGDGQLDLEEALNQGMTEQMFKNIDADDDGFVTKEEFRAWMDSQAPTVSYPSRG